MRIVSLLPAATEIVGALGGLEQLVGVSHECDHPRRVASLPRVTSSRVPVGASAIEIDAAVRALDAEGGAIFAVDEALIATLRPDLLLTQALCDVCAVSEHDVRALAERLSPSPRIVTLGGTTLDGIFTDIAAVADVLGLRDEADEMIAGLRVRMRTVHTSLKRARAPRPRVAVIEWTDPIFVAGHWVPELVKRAGGVDVLAKAGEHSQVRAMSEAISADPGIIIIAPCGYDLEQARDEARSLLVRHEWGWLEGREVWAMDANALISRPAPRVVDGLETMARIFNPALFSPVLERHAVRVQ